MDTEGQGSAPAEQPNAGAAAPAQDQSNTGAAPPAAAAPEKPAEGSEKKPESLFESVTKALEPAPPAEAAKPAEGEKKPDGEGEKKPEGEKAGEKETTEPGKAQERIRELVAERKSLEPRAHAWDQMRTWVHQNGLTHEDVQFHLGLAALVRSDPFKAREQLAPLIKHLDGIVGNELPADLKDRVEKGSLTEADAREIAAGRGKTKVLEGRERERTEQDERTREQEAIQTFARSCGAAVAAWETQWKAGDPDYAKKKDRVQAEIFALWAAEGQPDTPEKAVDQAKRARKSVEDFINGITPPRRELNPARGGEAPGAKAAPKSALEAADMALSG